MKQSAVSRKLEARIASYNKDLADRTVKWPQGFHKPGSLRRR